VADIRLDVFGREGGPADMESGGEEWVHGRGELLVIREETQDGKTQDTREEKESATHGAERILLD